MTFEATFNIADVDGSNGFLIDRVSTADGLGVAFSGAGDINGDGIEDLLISAPNTEPDGRVYVVFGGSNVGTDGSFDPASLTGANGFSINGEGRRTQFGTAVSSAGDVNGDGFDDILIGSPGSNDPAPFLGRSYIFFGGPNVGSSGSIEARDLNGNNGFVLTSSSRLRQGIGTSVDGVGDVNGDGIDDFIVGAPGDAPSGRGTGQTYVVFGRNGSSSGSFDLAQLNGNNGFSIQGFDAPDGRPGRAGSSVSGAGDVNGDGINDLIIGAPSASSDSVSGAGESYIVFGSRALGNSGNLSLSNLNGSNGFAIQGINRNENAGTTVSGAGDINADGIDDFVVGVPGADPNGISNAGQSYVFFGRSNVGASGSIKLSDINGSNGFVVNGIRSFTGTGRTLSEAGDLNNDSVDDLLIGGGNDSAYVVYGTSGIGSSGVLELADLDGENGTTFFIPGSFAGRSASGIGDFNGDGIDDIVAGKPTDGLTSGTRAVVFGMGERETDTNPPVAVDDEFFTDEDTELVGNVLTNDSDPDGDSLSTTVVSRSANGNITLNSDGSFSYVPQANFNGVANFAYEVNDGTGRVDRAEVVINVAPINDAPIARDDSQRITSDNDSTTVNVLTNDQDPDRDPLTVESTGNPDNGSAVINANGSITYTPTSGFTGQDSFTYTINDGELSDSATVNIDVDSRVTEPPVEPPTEPPVEPPTEPPVEPPTEPPVEPPTEPPVEPPTEPPVEPPTEPPVEPPTEPPTKSPIEPTDPPAFDRIDNFLVAEEGDASPLRIGSGNDYIAGTTGKDEIFGDRGDDILRGDPENSTGSADSIFGGPGDDILLGKGGNDLLFGEAGADLVVGDSGDDLLFGGTGNDILCGDSLDGTSGGRDIFAIAPGSGTDTILDFEVGTDVIGLSDGLSLGQLYVVQHEANTAIGTYEGELLAVLINVSAEQLGHSSFVRV